MVPLPLLKTNLVVGLLPLHLRPVLKLATLLIMEWDLQERRNVSRPTSSGNGSNSSSSLVCLVLLLRPLLQANPRRHLDHLKPTLNHPLLHLLE